MLSITFLPIKNNTVFNILQFHVNALSNIFHTCYVGEYGYDVGFHTHVEQKIIKKFSYSLKILIVAKLVDVLWLIIK